MNARSSGPGEQALETHAAAKRPRLFSSTDPRYWLRLLGVGLLGGLVLALLGYTALYVHALTRPAPSEICCITPDALGHDYRPVRFAGADGVQLAG